MTQRCAHCQEPKPLNAFYPDKSKRLGVHSVCRECVKADRKARYWADPALYAARNREQWRKHGYRYRGAARKLRERVLDAYGRVCRCCGEATPEFLGIDHVNNDGEAHRRELKGYGRSIYRWLSMEGFPQDGRFQLLCHNCNMAKGLYGGCPHQRASVQVDHVLGAHMPAERFDEPEPLRGTADRGELFDGEGVVTLG